jgi:hypothetical protein
MFAALAGLTIAGTLALSGCTSTAGPEEPDPAAQGSDEASAFLACLTAADVEAKINASGQVLVKTPGELGGDGVISSDDGSGEGLLGMERDDAGNTWVAVASADYFVDSPEVRDAYAACEKEHPDFEQAQFDPSDDPAFQEDAAKQEEDALAFAQCAREQGYSQIADPDFSAMNGILIPSGFTEQEFRALIEACWDPNSSFAFGSHNDLTFEPWTIVDEFQNAPAS